MVLKFLFILLLTPQTLLAADPTESSLEQVKKMAAVASLKMESAGAKWRCDIDKQFSCSVTSCKDVPPTVWVLLDFKEKKYQRCDKAGCSDASWNYERTGAFSTFGGHGAFLKIQNNGSEFVEAVTVFTSALLGFGKCTPVK